MHYRKGILQSIALYINIIGPQNDLIKILINGCQDEKWRVRQQALLTIIDVLKETKKFDLFEKNFETHYMKFFTDRVNFIKMKAIESLGEVINEDWI